MPRNDMDRRTWAQAQRNADAVITAGRRGVAAASKIIGIEGVNIVRVLVTGPSPSSPGGPPGLVFGGLRLSYAYDTAELRPDRHRIDVGSDAATRRPITGEPVDYAKYQEEGTSNMAPRPHLRPAMAILMPLIPPIVSRSIEAHQRAAAVSLRGVSVDH